MSTRSLTNVYDDKNKCIVTMYRQMDGYPDGHGKDLADFLLNRVVGNGIGMNCPKRFANGPNCLAAQIVTHFKGSDESAGGIYLYPAGQTDCGEEYIYHVYAKYNAPICVSIYDVWSKRFLIEMADVESLMEYCSAPRDE